MDFAIEVLAHQCRHHHHCRPNAQTNSVIDYIRAMRTSIKLSSSANDYACFVSIFVMDLYSNVFGATEEKKK